MVQIKIISYIILLILAFNICNAISCNETCECKIYKHYPNIVIYDYIEPDGIGANCNYTLAKDGTLYQTGDMIKNSPLYTINFTDLPENADYSILITCSLLSADYTSYCEFDNDDISKYSGEDYTNYEPATLSYPYFMDINQSEYIVLYYDNITSDRSAYINFENTNYSMFNMSNYYYIYLANNDVENISFDVYINHTNGTTLYHNDGIMRWRDPFYVVIELKYLPYGADEPLDYTNDFNYVYLTLHNDTPGYIDFGQSSFYSLGWMDSLSESVLGFSITNNNQTNYDLTLSQWSSYSNGEAFVKMYEPGIYDLNIINTRVKTSEPWKYEFVYPQYSGTKYYSKITKLEIVNNTDQSFSVIMDKWEVDKMAVLFNMIYIIFIVILWIIVASVITIYGGVKVGGAVASVTLPLMLYLIGVI